MVYKLEDGVTQSLLSTWQTCRRKCRYQLDGWESPGQSVNMEFGNLLHACIALQTRSPKLSPDAVWSRSALVWAKQNPRFIRREFLLAMAQPVWLGCTEFYHNQIINRKWLFAERVFDTVLSQFRLRGKIDGAYLCKSRPWLREIKCKSQIDDDGLLDTLSFDFQNLFYCLLYKLVDGSYPDGVEYDVIRIPSYKVDDPGALETKIKSEIEKDPTHFFKRYEAVYHRDDHKGFLEELLARLDEFGKWTRAEVATYRNETACIGRGKCEFIKLCASGLTDGYVQTRELFRELKEDEPCQQSVGLNLKPLPRKKSSASKPRS